MPKTPIEKALKERLQMLRLRKIDEGRISREAKRGRRPLKGADARVAGPALDESLPGRNPISEWAESRKASRPRDVKGREELSEAIASMRKAGIGYEVRRSAKEGFRYHIEPKPLAESAERGANLREDFEYNIATSPKGVRVKASGRYRETRARVHEIAEVHVAGWGAGRGDYSWVNRPWQRFDFDSALREAGEEAGLPADLLDAASKEAGSLDGWVEYIARHIDGYAEGEGGSPAEGKAESESKPSKKGMVCEDRDPGYLVLYWKDGEPDNLFDDSYDTLGEAIRAAKRLIDGVQGIDAAEICDYELTKVYWRWDGSEITEPDADEPADRAAESEDDDAPAIRGLDEAPAGKEGESEPARPGVCEDAFDDIDDDAPSIRI